MKKKLIEIKVSSFSTLFDENSLKAIQVLGGNDTIAPPINSYDKVTCQFTYDEKLCKEINASGYAIGRTGCASDGFNGGPCQSYLVDRCFIYPSQVWSDPRINNCPIGDTGVNCVNDDI